MSNMFQGPVGSGEMEKEIKPINEFKVKKGARLLSILIRWFMEYYKCDKQYVMRKIIIN